MQPEQDKLYKHRIHVIRFVILVCTWIWVCSLESAVTAKLRSLTMKNRLGPGCGVCSLSVMCRIDKSAAGTPPTATVEQLMYVRFECWFRKNRWTLDRRVPSHCHGKDFALCMGSRHPRRSALHVGRGTARYAASNLITQQDLIEFLPICRCLGSHVTISTMSKFSFGQHVTDQICYLWRKQVKYCSLTYRIQLHIDDEFIFDACDRVVQCTCSCSLALLEHAVRSMKRCANIINK